VKIEFNLLGNARDSLERAFELVAWGDQQQEARRLKQAVQAIAHAIELLLKERLRAVHPCLLWEQVDRYPNLNARTVSAELAADRLQNIGGLRFQASDLALLRSLRATRNAIEHYAWTTTKPEADAIVGRALEFAFHFAKTELSEDYLDYSAHKDGTYAALVASNPEFQRATHARRSHQEVLADPISPTCTFCRARSVDPETRTCKLCGHWEAEAPERLDDDIPF